MRTLLVLAFIAAGLLGFILLVDRGTVSDDDLARREGRVLQRFFRDRIGEITIKAGGKTTTLIRRPEEGELALGTWYVEQPYVAEADQAAVDLLLGELEWMDARRRLTGVSAGDRKQFGLEQPSFEVGFQLGREQGQLIVGRQSPKGDGFYVEAERDGGAFVVGRELVEVLDHEPEYYHSKVLHDGLMAETTNELVIHMDGKTYQLARREGAPWMTKPATGLVNTKVLRQLMDTLDRLQAKRFIQATVEERPAPRFGFGAPWLDIQIEKRSLRDDAAKREGDERYDIVPVRFRFGAPCGSHEGERYLLLGDTGPVMCVAEADLAPVRQAVSQLRERRLAAVSKRRTSLIAIEDDAAQLTLRSDGDGFVAEYTPAEGKAVSEPTHVGSVEAWIEQLATVEAIRSDAVPLAHPDGGRKMRFEREGEVILTLALRREGDAVLVLRDGEPMWSEFPPAAWELTSPNPAKFRNHQLLSYPIESLRSLKLTERVPVQALQWGGMDADARMSIPQDLAADPQTVRELSRRLATLEAVRFVDETFPQNRPEELSVLDMEFADAAGGLQRHQLQIVTAPTVVEGEAQHLAQLDRRGGTFTLPADLISRLRAPWLSRGLLAQPLAEMVALRIEGDPPCTVLRDGDGFEFSRGGESAERAQRIAEAWATVHATTLRFAAPPKRTLTVVQEMAAGQQRELLFPVADDAEVAFVKGLDVAFDLPMGQRAALLRCASTTE